MARPTLTARRTQPHQPEALFDSMLGTPAVGSEDFLFGGEINDAALAPYLEAWEERREAGIKGLNESELDDSEQLRAEFLRGAHMIGLIGRRKTILPHQYRIADLLNVGQPNAVILMPRRSTKTTALFAAALGRCASRPGYQVAFTTCTTGQKARERFRKDVVNQVNLIFPDEKNRPFRIYLSAGSERIQFANGSSLQVLPPIGDNFRGDAFDMVIIDEAGEAGPEMTEDLMQGILSTFDTRPGAQLVITGTAAKFRDGNLLWDTLVDGRTGQNRTSILEYAAPDSTTDDELNDWEKVKKLVLASHPGVGLLTELETVRERWMKLKRQQFAEEYLSIFGTTGATTGILDQQKWRDGALKTKLPKPPDKFVIGIAVHPEQSFACIVAAWRVKGKARLLVLEHKHGVDWLAKRARELSATYRAPIVHDTNGPVTVEVEALQRMRSPKPRLMPQNLANIKTAAALLVKEVENGRVQHYDQDMLNQAARLAKKRPIGPTAWAFGRKNFEDDITPIEAAAIALRVYDETQAKSRNMTVRHAA